MRKYDRREVASRHDPNSGNGLVLSLPEKALLVENTRFEGTPPPSTVILSIWNIVAIARKNILLFDLIWASLNTASHPNERLAHDLAQSLSLQARTCCE